MKIQMLVMELPQMLKKLSLLVPLLSIKSEALNLTLALTSPITEHALMFSPLVN